MGGWLRRFLLAEDGQDLVEYSFLLIFIVVAGACFLYFDRDAIAGITATTNRNVALANAVATRGAGGH